jgi:hypothetical protein
MDCAAPAGVEGTERPVIQSPAHAVTREHGYMPVLCYRLTFRAGTISPPSVLDEGTPCKGNRKRGAEEVSRGKTFEVHIATIYRLSAVIGLNRFSVPLLPSLHRQFWRGRPTSPFPAILQAALRGKAAGLEAVLGVLPRGCTLHRTFGHPIPRVR